CPRVRPQRLPVHPVRTMRQQQGRYFVTVAFLPAGAACLAGACLAAGAGAWPFASTEPQSGGSWESVIGAFSGAGGTGEGLGGFLISASQRSSSAPHPSSFPTGGWASQLVLPLGQAMRIWKWEEGPPIGLILLS